MKLILSTIITHYFDDIASNKVLATLLAYLMLSLADFDLLIKVLIGIVSLIYISRKTYLLFVTKPQRKKKEQ